MLGPRCKYITVALVLVSVTASSVSENYLLLRLTFLVFDNVCCVGVSLRTTEKHRNIVYRAIIDDWYIYCRF